MIRATTTVTIALLLTLALPAGSRLHGSALACDDTKATAAEAASMESEATREATSADSAEARATQDAARAYRNAVEAYRAAARARRAPRAPEATSPPTPPVPPEAPMVETPAPPTPPVSDMEVPEAPRFILPRGWFGFGLQCEECTAKSGRGDAPAVWRFGTLPRVYSVDLGGPAARAGIRRGDTITHINGISLLSPEGGRRFGATRAGDMVRWTISRDGASRTVVARAELRPERSERVDLKDLREELSRLNEVPDLDQLRRELANLNRQLERSRLQDLERVRIRALPVRRLRYAGVIGGTEVEVRGPGSVIVTETDGRDELVINTGESIVVIRVPESMRKASGDKPK